MGQVFKIGAPSKGSPDVDVGSIEFPAAVALENHVRRIVMPDFNVDLLPDYERKDIPVVSVKNRDEMNRLVSNIEQVSELNGWDHAVTASVVSVDSKANESGDPALVSDEKQPVPDDVAGEEKQAKAETGSSKKSAGGGSKA